MDNSNTNKYISLKTAAGLYGYTRDHLGLMIRMGKLNGKKIGSYYVTTDEWMLNYIKNFADPTHPASKNKLSNKFVAEIFSAKRNIKNAPSGNNSELGTKILNELKQIMTPIADLSSQNTLKKFDLPYAILPIRQMNEGERKKILQESGIDDCQLST